LGKKKNQNMRDLQLTVGHLPFESPVLSLLRFLHTNPKP
jgi:hypothetical protein